MPSASVSRLDMMSFVILPLTFLWALLLASPFGWKYKAIAFIVATFLFFVFHAFQASALIRVGLAAGNIADYAISNSGFYNSFVRMLSVGMNIFAALIIWGIVALPKLWK